MKKQAVVCYVLDLFPDLINFLCYHQKTAWVHKLDSYTYADVY